MKRQIWRAAVLVICLSWQCEPAWGAPWNMPQELTDGNTSVRFTVDSTWHTIHGVTSGVTGRIWLADPSDYQSIRGMVALPVSQFDTDNSMRDKKLREVMGEKEFPEVTYELQRITGLCDPAQMPIGGRCEGKAGGTLSIHGNKKEILLPVTVESMADAWIISGKVEFGWRQFDVEDPSILVAKLNELVTVEVKLRLLK